jgi:hypothetical protein
MCLMRPAEPCGRVMRVPEDGVYTMAHLRNALERDEWDIPQYSPDDACPEGNNFAISQAPEREESEWRNVVIIGRMYSERQ